MTTQAKVEQALERYPVTRGSDRHLIVAVWFLQDKDWSSDPKKFILDRALSPETITRHRRKIQEKGRYLPKTSITEQRYDKFKQVKGGDLGPLK